MEPVIIRTTADQFIKPRKTAAYMPTVMGGDWYARAIDDKPWFTWRDVERMRRDPQIQFGLRILRAPLYRVQWTVEADTTRIAKLVDSTLHDLWDGYLQPMLTTQFTWGIVPGELSHRMSRGQVIVDRFDPVHPMDARPLEIDARAGGRQFVGLRIKGANQNPMDMVGASNCDVLTPHAWWHAGEAEFGSYYSRPRIADAYVSWSEKSAKGGAIESRRLWFKKCAFRGGTMRHPVGATEYVTGTGEAVVINNEDLARQIIERYENGGVLTLPNTTDANGNYLWIYEPPGTNGEASGIRDYPKDLDDEILKGLGIPPEIITAAETGSGWSGRAIPAMMFFSSEDEVAKGLIRTAEVQACRPLVGLNYGHKFTRRFKIKVKSLADILGEDPQAAKGILNEPDGRQQAGGLSGFNGGGQMGGGGDGGSGGSGGDPMGGGNPVQLSHEALEVLDRRLARDIAAISLGFNDSAKGRWITIGGRKGEDGKRHGGSPVPVFVQNGVITKGHPSLTGKKPSEINGDAADTSHRAELSRSRNYEVAKVRKLAKGEGIDPRHLDELAGQIRANHNEFAKDKVEMLQRARHYIGEYNGKSVNNLARQAASGKIDYTKIVGLDLATEEAVDRYPHHFKPESGANGSYYDQMFEMLVGGNPEQMSEVDAYEEALDHLRSGADGASDGDSSSGVDDDFNFGFNAVDDDDSIPLSFSSRLGFDESKVHRADDGKFSSPTKGTPATEPTETPESTSPLKSFVGIKLNGEAGKQFRKMAQMVSDQDLAEDGREDDPHVTVKYGLLTQTPEEVEKLLSNFGEVTIRIGRLSIFPATEGKDYEVLKAEVEGESLRKLNELLGSLPHIDSYAEYKPHATIAYLKPGLGEEYIRRLDWHGAYYTAHEVEFSNDARQKTIIPLVNANSGHGIA